jgi:sterol desaturase/sphingolipid hydroxylase (fatty acid hydroxylase superfamily)
MEKEILELFSYLGMVLVAFAAFFFPLARIFPARPGQSFLRRDMITDLFYWFGIAPISYPISKYLMSFLLRHFFDASTAEAIVISGVPPLNELPLWLQFLILALGVDVIQYWLHRLFHKSWLWRLHAIHHSSRNVDWLSSTRWHPLNTIFYVTLILALARLCGFDPRVFGWFVMFYSFNGALVHANLNWTYGPLRYVIASPIFHRWHHTSPREGGEKNFAPNFSFLDVIFGTFYMPQGARPETFGVLDDAPPEGFFAQLWYPFRKRSF